MEKQLFFTSNVQTHHKKEDVLLYEPHWQLGILDNERERMKRLERILGVEPSRSEQDLIMQLQQRQRNAIQEALDHGVVTAWVGPSAAEELAFMEIAETMTNLDQLRLRVVSGPLQLRERAAELFRALEKQDSHSSSEWQEQVPRFSKVEKGFIMERAELFKPIAREETYFDAELLAILSFQSGPMPQAKLVAEAYAKRPDLPVPFYLQRLKALVANNTIHLTTEGLLLNDRFESTNERSLQ